MEVWGIVVAAGLGTRFGGEKQFVELGARTVIDRAIGPAYAVCDRVVLVVPPDAPWKASPVTIAVAGAPTRSASVRAGLAAVSEGADVVVIHDGVRPLATEALWHDVIAAVVAGADGAVPALPVPDTLKRVVDGRVVETVPRDGLWAVQTPQAFRAEILRRAHEGEPEGTDDAALVEAVGGTVVVVDGDPRNLKLTVPADVDVARALLGEP